MRRAHAWGILAAALAAARVAQADVPPPPQQEQVDYDPRRDTPTDTRPVELFWKNGFGVRTRDDAFELRLLGIIQADARQYLNPGDTTDYDKFLVRRARLYAEGYVFKIFDYRWMVDFGQGEPAILDAFLNAHLLGDAIQVRAGKYKQPFSYEQFGMEDLTLPVFERSMLDRLAPARNVGAMVHGKNVFRGRLEYQLGLANGLRDSDFEEKRNEKDVFARVVVRPFADRSTELPALAHLHLGIGLGYGEETDAFDPGQLTTPLRVPWFHFAEGVQAAGARIRVSPELYWFFGPFGVGGQYLRQRQAVQAPDAPRTYVDIDSFFAMTSLVLTGEKRTNYAQFIYPKHPFDFSRPFGGGLGAVEAIARTSALWVHGAEDPGYQLLDPKTAVSSSAWELSLGLNWYLNRFVWVMLDYEHAEFGQPVALGGPGTGFQSSNAIAERLTVMW